MDRGSSVSVRRLWLRAHLWLGLLLGLVFVVLGLTGSLLVFYNELDRWFNPHTQARQPGAAHPSLVDVQRRLRDVQPSREGIWRVELPLVPEAPLTARYYRPAEREGRFFAPLMLTLDPVTLEPSSTRFWGDYAVTWIYDLHYTLLMQAQGRTLVGWLGVAMTVSILSGLYLWWPTARRALGALLPRLRPGVVRRTYDAHVLTGVYGSAVLLAVCLTGTALAWPETTRAVLGVTPHGAPAGASRETMLDVDQGLDIARDLFPHAEVRWVDLPGRTNTLLSVRLHQVGEPGRRFPKTQVWVDLADGRIVAVHDPMRSGAAHWLMTWLHPLHNGEAFGLTGRVLVCLSGLAPLVLMITGWLRWLQKRRAHVATRLRRA